MGRIPSPGDLATSQCSSQYRSLGFTKVNPLHGTIFFNENVSNHGLLILIFIILIKNVFAFDKILSLSLFYCFQ